MKQHTPGPSAKTCERCGKVAFDTEGAAMLTAMRIRNKGAPAMRVYACGPYWHLTKGLRCRGCQICTCERCGDHHRNQA